MTIKFCAKFCCGENFMKIIVVKNGIPGTKVFDFANNALKMNGLDKIYECFEIKFRGRFDIEYQVKDGDVIEDGRSYFIKLYEISEKTDEYCEILHDLDAGIEKNVLILGETGVGKSTWINAFANYVTFASLDEALLANGPICLIPTSFEMVYEGSPILIQQGNVEDSEENLNSGKSATGMPKAHVFETAKNGRLRLIDTPGIGDTDGIEQDKKNMINILRYIATLKDIHAICVLMKPNLSRLTAGFKYCIGELFANLHKSAANNIVFCFTNSRATLFQPGDTLRPLRVYLNELKNEYGVSILLSPETCFCFDNDCFRYLCALKCGMPYDVETKNEMSKSWVSTVRQTFRFMERVVSLAPHSTANTISLNEARRVIETLAPALARITQAVQANIAAVDEHKDFLQKIDETQVGLRQKLKVPVISVQSNALARPRTVCTSVKCVGTSADSTGHVSAVYKTVCHEICYLDGITVFPDPLIKNCYAFNHAENCRFCRCGWDSHRHIFSEPVEQKKMVDDPSVLQLLMTNDDKKAAISKAIENCEAKKKQYEDEQKRINEIAARFGLFLRRNAIVAYNDAVKSYIQMSIREAEVVAKNTKNQAKVEGLKRALADYEAQKQLITRDCGDSGVNGLADIKIVYDELVNLSLTGSNIKQLFDAENLDRQKEFEHTENKFKAERFITKPSYPSISPPSSTSSSSSLKKIEEEHFSSKQLTSAPLSVCLVKDDVSMLRKIFDGITGLFRKR